MEIATNDCVSIQLKFADGSICSVNYFSNGPKKLQKERIEIFANGKYLRLDNFRRLTSIGWPELRDYSLGNKIREMKVVLKRLLRRAN